MPARLVVEVDAFDLPEWLGECEVTWRAGSSVRGSHHVAGDLVGGSEPLACDLLAADLAFPQPVLDDDWRRSAHQQWTHGQVLLVEYDGRLTLAVPGTEFTADRVLESLGRLAKALGVKPSRFVAAMRL
ncbi:MAG TPA: hypothetical protein VFJ83_16125 [Nocardioidaceae bacterium]|nr:hypothetical protein [Nocardioidaceae bacterium]